MPSMQIVLLLTFLLVAAHYGIYAYITLPVELIGLAGGISGAADLWASLDRHYVLTTVMLYWLTGHVLCSARAYYDLDRRPDADRPTQVSVPTAVAPYPADKWLPPKSLFDPKEYKNTVRYTEPPRGGHFAAMEEPEFWAEGLMGFFSTLAP
jgi:pimeloyl-ACP methyl ester carboxylesterase